VWPNYSAVFHTLVRFVCLFVCFVVDQLLGEPGILPARSRARLD
jgi:hypothetical protein